MVMGPHPEPVTLERSLGNCYRERKKKSNVSWVVTSLFASPVPLLSGCWVRSESAGGCLWGRGRPLPWWCAWGVGWDSGGGQKPRGMPRFLLFVCRPCRVN